MHYVILLVLACIFIFMWVRLWQNQQPRTPKPVPEPFFQIANPSHILFGNKPPLLGGKLEPITREAFEAKENITWTNSPVTYRNTLHYLAIEPDALGGSLVGEFNHFAICDLGLRLGKGAFATKPIKKGTVIGIYSGMLNLTQSKYANQYELNASIDPEKIFFYDAIHFRNVTSYIQHAPDTALENIATANLKIQNMQHGDIVLALYVANRDIEPNEQLLVNYGKTYWGPRSYQLFDKNGQALHSNLSLAASKPLLSPA